MQVSFNLEEKDLRVGMSHATAALLKELSPKLALVVNMLVWVCIAIVILALCDAYQYAKSLSVTVGIAGGLAVALAFGYLIYRQKRITEACVAAYGPFPIPQEVSLSDDCLELHSRAVAARYPWSAVVSVRETPQHLVFVLRPLSAVAVPTSAFVDSGTSKAFLAYALSRVAS